MNGSLNNRVRGDLSKSKNNSQENLLLDSFVSRAERIKGGNRNQTGSDSRVKTNGSGTGSSNSLKLK